MAAGYRVICVAWWNVASKRGNLLGSVLAHWQKIRTARKHVLCVFSPFFTNKSNQRCCTFGSKGRNFRSPCLLTCLPSIAVQSQTSLEGMHTAWREGKSAAATRKQTNLYSARQNSTTLILHTMPSAAMMMMMKSRELMNSSGFAGKMQNRSAAQDVSGPSIPSPEVHFFPGSVTTVA